jgi:hypothetical protein
VVRYFVIVVGIGIYRKVVLRLLVLKKKFYRKVYIVIGIKDTPIQKWFAGVGIQDSRIEKF